MDPHANFPLSRPMVYLETTIVSYLTARPSRDLIVAGHQQITREWWEDTLPKVDAFVSPFVLEEASRGDSDQAEKRVSMLAPFPSLNASAVVDRLAKLYFEGMGLPEKAKLDAFHLATAVAYEMDYLLSWNCKHLASGRTQRILQRMNSGIGLPVPVLCTPEELMEI